MELMEAIHAAYAILGDLTPMETDCGTLCQAACCQADEDGQGGVWLLGDEQTILQNVPWADIDPIADPVAPMLVCKAPCDRKLRPLCCRIFPLAPVMGRDGLWTVRIDARARAMCPLAASGLKGLRREFVRAARDAMRALAFSTQGEQLLRAWSERESAFRQPLW